MLYKKILLDYPEIDDLRRNFRQFCVHEMIKMVPSDELSNCYISHTKTHLEEILESFDIHLGPFNKLGEMLTHRTDILDLSDNIGLLGNVRRDDVLYEYIDCLLVSSFCKNEAAYPLLQAEEDSVFTMLCETRRSSSSTEQQEAFRSIFQQAANNAVGFCIEMAMEENINGIKEQLQKLHEEYEKKKTRLEQQIRGLENSAQDPQMKELLDLFETGDIELKRRVLEALGANLSIYTDASEKSLDDPDAAYMLAMYHLESYKSLPFRIDEVKAALNRADAEWLKEQYELIDAQQKICKETLPLVTEIKERLNNKDVTDYHLEIEETFFSCMIEAVAIYRQLKERQERFFAKAVPFTETECCIANLLSTILDNIQQKNCDLSEAEALYLLEGYFSLPSTAIIDNYIGYQQKFFALLEAEVNNSNYCHEKIVKELQKDITLDSIMPHIMEAIDAGHITLSLSELLAEGRFNDHLDDAINLTISMAGEEWKTDRTDAMVLLKAAVGKIKEKVFKQDIIETVDFYKAEQARDPNSYSNEEIKRIAAERAIELYSMNIERPIAEDLLDQLIKPTEDQERSPFMAKQIALFQEKHKKTLPKENENELRGLIVTPQSTPPNNNQTKRRPAAP
ncbi:MAG: hypothetical protein ACOYK8_10475 [Alphaproteobacteria bacterium]